MAVHDGLNIGPRLVDFAMYEALEETATPIRVDRIAVEAVLDDVPGRYQRRRDRARHQVALGCRRMAHRDVTEAVDHALGGEDAARGRQVRDLLGCDRTAGF